MTILDANEVAYKEVKASLRKMSASLDEDEIAFLDKLFPDLDNADYDTLKGAHDLVARTLRKKRKEKHDGYP